MRECGQYFSKYNNRYGHNTLLLTNYIFDAFRCERTTPEHTAAINLYVGTNTYLYFK